MNTQGKGEYLKTIGNVDIFWMEDFNKYGVKSHGLIGWNGFHVGIEDAEKQADKININIEKFNKMMNK